MINGYTINKDPNTRWPNRFDWLVTRSDGLRLGWFGSLESAQAWIAKSGIMEGVTDGRQEA